MGGEETIRRLLATDPQVSAIVSSGYSGDPVVSNFEAYRFKAAVRNPYLIRDLDKALQIAQKAKPGTWLQDQNGKWYQK